jgi:alpha-ribazole phosphatase
VERGVASVTRGLWVVRHAPVSVRGVCYGQSDVATEVDDATAAERVHAQLLAGEVTVARLWTSPWKRTRGLAAALGARLGLEVTVDARLSELAFGAWEGRSYAEIEASDGARFTGWMADWQRAAPPGGECVAELVARIDAWRLEAGAHGGLAITHAGPIRTLRALGRGVGYGDVAAEAVEPLALEALA